MDFTHASGSKNIVIGVRGKSKVLSLTVKK